MLAARLRGPRQLSIEETQKPRPGPGEVLVRVAAVGVCRSDISLYTMERKEMGEKDLGLVFGHEASGVIEELGEGVEGLAAGQLVALEPTRHCGQCDMCRAGRFNICREIKFWGYPPTDGALQQYVLSPAAMVFPLPEGMSAEEGAMVEPLSVGVQAVRQAGIQPGQWAVVQGAGAIGLSIAQVLRACGVEEIVVIEPSPFRRQLLQSAVGGSSFSSSEEAEALLRHRRGGRGADYVFEATGSESAPQQSVQLADNGGTVMIVGIFASDRFLIPASVARAKELTLRFVRRSNAAFPETLRLLQEGRLSAQQYATHLFPFSEVAQAYALTERRPEGFLRAVVRVDQ